MFTFGFVRGKESVARVLIDMDYVASEKLDNLVRLGFFPDVQFTYVVRSVQLILLNRKRTLNDVRDSRAKALNGDGLASDNLSNGRK